MKSFQRVFLFGAAWLLCSAASAQTATISPRAVQTLVDSNAISISLGGPDKVRDRISFLVRLTRVSAEITPNLTEAWCEELFSLASQSPLGWDRVANQKNAAVPLAGINPKRAMELLGKVDRPQPHTVDRTYSEDVRADAAATIFPSFVQHLKLTGLTLTQALAQVRHLGKKIGETGEYPYRAMALVIARDEVKTSTDYRVSEQAQAIFDDGFAYYKRHSQFEDEEPQFFELLASARYVVSPQSYHEALKLYVDRVSVPSKNRGVFAAVVKTNQGSTVRLDDENEHLLLQVLPLVKSVDQKWWGTLIENNPELKQAAMGVEQLGTAFISGNPPQDYVERRRPQLLDNALLRRIESLSRDKATIADAIEKAYSIKTLPARIIGFSYVLPNAAQSNPTLAKAMYSEELEDLQHISNPLDDLKAKAAIAKSAYYLQDMEEFNVLNTQVFDTGVLLFGSDTQHVWTDLRNGYREMAAIVEFSAEHDVSSVLEKVSQMDNYPLLKAHLLIFEAKGFQAAEQDVTVAAASPKKSN